LGAAIALQATASTAGVCAVVAEAPFSSFREIGYERIAQAMHVGVAVAHWIAWPTVEIAFLDARLRYGLNFERASPESSLAQSHVPALLIAGLADRNIPPRHAQRILLMSSGNSTLWQVPGAGHTGAAGVDPTLFSRRVLQWFQAHRNSGVQRIR
jgi:pimeloyl-ACP methyl ester carboxylesterase